MEPLEGISSFEKQSTQEISHTPEVSSPELPEDIKSLLTSSDIWDETKGVQNEELLKFNTYLSINSERSEDIYKLLRTINANDLGDYIYENGYIINNDTFQAFQKKFQISGLDEVIDSEKEVIGSEKEVIDSEKKVIDSEKEVIDSDKEVIKSEKEQIDGFNTLFQKQIQNLSTVSGSSETLQLVQEAQKDITKSPDAIKAIQEFFQNLSRPEKSADFDKIAHTFDSQSPQAYKEYKEYAMTQNPKLNLQFARYEKFRGVDSIVPKSELHRVQIAAGLDNNPQVARKYGQFREIQDGENITVMNIGEEPPIREVGISKSTMRLERNVPIGNFYSTISNEGLDYENYSNTNDPTLEAITTIQGNLDEIVLSLEGDMKIEGAEELGIGEDMTDTETQDISDTKKDIEEKFGLPKGVTLDSLAQISGTNLNSRKDIITFIQSSDMSSLLGDISEEKKSKRHIYQDALAKKSLSVSQSLEKGDSIARDVIETFHGLGIDVAWDDIQQLLKNTDVQTHLQSVMGNGFSLVNIDLANGMFGQSGSSKESISMLHQNIAKFANIIYFGEPEPQKSPIKMSDYARYTLGGVPTPTAEIINLQKEQKLIIAGSINLVTLQNRLSGKG